MYNIMYVSIKIVGIVVMHVKWLPEQMSFRFSIGFSLDFSHSIYHTNMNMGIIDFNILSRFADNNTIMNAHF